MKSARYIYCRVSIGDREYVYNGPSKYFNKWIVQLLLDNGESIRVFGPIRITDFLNEIRIP